MRIRRKLNTTVCSHQTQSHFANNVEWSRHCACVKEKFCDCCCSHTSLREEPIVADVGCHYINQAFQVLDKENDADNTKNPASISP